jgi:periplasmic divalent cation tolerance protein
MLMDLEYVVVMTMCADEDEGREIARRLVSSRLAACVNLVPGCTSCYRWKGEIRMGSEVMLLVKTRHSLAPEVFEAIRQGHSYELPEGISIPIVDGSAPYLEWIAAETSAGAME